MKIKISAKWRPIEPGEDGYYFFRKSWNDMTPVIVRRVAGQFYECGVEKPIDVSHGRWLENPIDLTQPADDEE